jgi:hypothetical protein
MVYDAGHLIDATSVLLYPLSDSSVSLYYKALLGGSIVFDLANSFEALSSDAKSFLYDGLWYSKAGLSIRSTVGLGSVAVGCGLGISAVGARGYGVQG